MDGIKFNCVAADEKIAFLKTKCDFIMKVANSGELVGSSEYAYHRGLRITIRRNNNVTIGGSLHKAFNNGINYNDFSYLDCKEAIQTLCSELGIEPQDLTIQRIEFGVNIYNPRLPFSKIENNLLMHRSTPFSTYSKGRLTMGFFCEHQQYTLKIYDKSIQENLSENVLRLEYKITKMQHLKSYGIRLVSDLLDKDKIQKVGQLVYKDFMSVLMDNCEEMEKAKLTFKESNFYLKARNVKYWSRLKRDFSQSLCTSHKRRFKKLVNVYAKCDLTTLLSDIFLEKWQILLTNETTFNTLDKPLLTLIKNN